jgi:hypothetical protein
MLPARSPAALLSSGSKPNFHRNDDRKWGRGRQGRVAMVGGRLWLYREGASVPETIKCADGLVHYHASIVEHFLELRGGIVVLMLEQLWSADEDFIGRLTASTAKAIANTADPTLYRTERYGDFSYQFSVAIAIRSNESEP